MTTVSKKGLRQLFFSRRDGLSDQERQEANGLVIKHLMGLTAYQKSTKIAGYWALSKEIDLSDLITAASKERKDIYLPRVNKEESRLEFCLYDGNPDNLSAGPYGILEPGTPEIAPSKIELVIVPGLAFDMHGHRLGYGAGYYDRFLKETRARAIGVAFDIQTIDILPIAEHDVAVDTVITESRAFPKPLDTL